MKTAALSAVLLSAVSALAACSTGKPWHPGAYHPVAGHVIAGAEYGEWIPEPGYAWDDPSATAEDAEVHWAPGTPHPWHPHVVAGPKPTQWMPAEGFAWAKSGADVWRVVPAK